jgi:carboxylesterase
MINWLRSKPRRIDILGIFLVFIAVLLFMAFKPYHLTQEVASNPVTSYGEALARVDAIIDAEAEHPDLNPECGTILMTHGRKVDNLVVFLHGFTSCPIQFAKLGEAYFDQGYNVLFPGSPGMV